MKSRVFSGGCGKRFWARLCRVLLLLTSGVCAHPSLQNSVFVDVKPQEVRIHLYVSLRELNVVQGLPVATDGSVDLEMAEEVAPRHSPYILDHLHLKADGNPLSGQVAEITPPSRIGKGLEASDRAYFIYQLVYPLAMPPAKLELSHTMVKEFPSAPGIDWDVSYAYRYGAPGETPRQFGVMPRGTVISFATGFLLPPGTVPAASPAFSRSGFPFDLALLGAALGLGLPNSAGRKWLVLPLCAGVAFAAGWALAMASGWAMPGFLGPALAGTGILLASVDTIHRGASSRLARRSGWIFSLFPAAAGWSVWSSPAGTTAGIAALEGIAVLLGGLMAGAVLSMAIRRSGTREDTPTVRAPLQWVSLVICVGGLAVLLNGLGIHPWAYWLERVSR